MALLAPGRPPQGARPCRRCCAAVDELARLVLVVQADSVRLELLRATDRRQRHPVGQADQDTHGVRPVEDGDLLGSIPTEEA